MKIFVFGPTGKVGSALVRKLDNDGHHVWGVTRQVCDITSMLVLDSFIWENKPDLVINCTAYNGLEACQNDKERALQINGHAPASMSVVCQKFDIPFIHFSTDYVFSGTQRGEVLRETDPVHPIWVYGNTKLVGEDQALAFNNQALVFRLTTIYGDAFGGPTDAVKQAQAGKGTADNPIMVLHQFCNPTSARFVADAISHVINNIEGSWDKYHGIYHLSTTGGIWKKEFSEYLLKWFDYPTAIVKIGNLAIPRPIYSIFDVYKFEDAFNYRLVHYKVDLFEAFKHIK